MGAARGAASRSAPSNANFDATYGPRNGAAKRPPIDVTLTIRPRAVRSGSSSAWVTATWPTRLTSSWRRSSSSSTNSSGRVDADARVVDEAGERLAGEALAERRDLRGVRHVDLDRHDRPGRRVRTSSSPSASRRTPASTSKPPAASRSAVALPMPVDAPVTTTVPRCGHAPTLHGRHRQPVRLDERDHRVHVHVERVAVADGRQRLEVRGPVGVEDRREVGEVGLEARRA